MRVETHYKHLEARPDSWRKQWYLKERNVTVWHVVGRMQAHSYSSAEAAEQFDVPLAAVLEAVDYYQRHMASGYKVLCSMVRVPGALRRQQAIST